MEATIGYGTLRQNQIKVITVGTFHKYCSHEIKSRSDWVSVGENYDCKIKLLFFRQVVNRMHVLKVSGYKFEQQQKGYANIY